MHRIRPTTSCLLCSCLLVLAACGGDDDPTDPGGGGGGGGTTWDPPTAASARTTGGLNIARILPTATLLQDGRVLVAGGFDGAVKLSSCEIYDPETETWSVTGSMGVVRVNHSATLLTDGRVLVAGGSNADSRSIKTFEIYDPAAGTWSAIEPWSPPNDPGSEMLRARSGHAATLLNDGNVLVTGGFDSFLSSHIGGDYEDTYELFLTDLGEFEWPDPPIGRMLDRRYCHSSTLLPDGRVLLAGGFNYEGDYLTACDIYDAAGDTCVAAAPMNTRRMWHGTFLLDDGRVFVTGGKNLISGFTNTCEIYDPVADSWTTTASMRELRNRPAYAHLSDGRVVAAGNLFTHTSEICIPGGPWAFSHDLLEQRHLFTMTVFANDVVLVVGGQDALQGGNEGYLASCELYVP